MNRAPGRCFICGCSEEQRCPQGCTWNSPGLCTACAGLGMGWRACVTCGKPIVWCETVNGKRMPVDCQPRGEVLPNQVISAGRDLPRVRSAHSEYIRLQVVPGGPLRSGVSHFANCPQAAIHRRKARP